MDKKRQDELWKELSTDEGIDAFREFQKIGTLYLKRVPVDYDTLAGMFLGMLATGLELDYKKSLISLQFAVESQEAVESAKASGVEQAEIMQRISKASRAFEDSFDKSDEKKKRNG